MRIQTSYDPTINRLTVRSWYIANDSSGSFRQSHAVFAWFILPLLYTTCTTILWQCKLYDTLIILMWDKIQIHWGKRSQLPPNNILLLEESRISSPHTRPQRDGQVKSSQVVGLRVRVAVIRTLIFRSYSEFGYSYLNEESLVKYHTA